MAAALRGERPTLAGNSRMHAQQVQVLQLVSRDEVPAVPIAEVEEDLKVIRSYQPKARRVFLTGANPFVLSYDRLLELGLLIRKYLRHCESIGMFARISDIKPKTAEELKNLRHLGFDGISIGTESGDDDTLAAMNKGYAARDIIEQCKKLEEADIRYNFVYLTGLAGERATASGMRCPHGRGIFNRLHPFTINIVMPLTVFPESELYGEIRHGNFVEAPEHERLSELRTLISRLRIETTLLGNTVSNAVPFIGRIPDDKVRLLDELNAAMRNVGERELRRYRETASNRCERAAGRSAVRRKTPAILCIAGVMQNAVHFRPALP